MSSYNGGATATARANHARADQTALRLVKGVDLDAFRATQPPAQTQVLLAEAFDLVRVGLRSLLEREGDIIVVGESRSGENLIALATELRPDVLLMDIRLPGLDALAAARQLRTHPELPQLRVVILAAAERTEDLVGAVRSGIDGFVSHGADPVDVVRAVRVVAAGGAYLSPRAARWLLDELAANLDFPQACSEQFEDLADRERELVLLAARGLSNAEIAERLAISPATVETHIGRAMAKLHTHGGAKLGALAYQSGFVKHYRATDAKMDRQPSASHLVDATQEMIARRRVIAAADEERRRVVRDLHDGAQQRLVEAMLVLRLALRRLEDADPEMRALVEEALRGTEQANSELRDLAHGILPPVLTRFGLKAALPALTDRKAGQTYPTPRGPMKWTGTGWVAP